MNIRCSRSQSLLRILFSTDDECLCELIADVVHSFVRDDISLAIITPSATVESTLLSFEIDTPGHITTESTLLETATRQRFDLAILLVNNILYLPYELSNCSQRIMPGAIGLVGTMKRLFRKPVLAWYGWPQIDSFETRLVEAGATGAFRIPNSFEQFKEALKSCLPAWCIDLG